MSRLSRPFAALLVVLVVSPFAVPLLHCDLAALIVRVPPPPTNATRPDGTPRLSAVGVHIIAIDESRRLKDDSDSRLSPPPASAYLTEAPEPATSLLWPPERPRAAPLVLRI